MERNENKTKRLQEEFREFYAMEGAGPPKIVTENILEKIHSKLNPPASSVFMKLTLIQFLVGTSTLVFCPQFGISFTSSHGLMHYLMQYGEAVCMLGCGALFTGMSVLVASFALRPEEVKILKRNRVLQLTSLATLSLGAFICFGGEVVATLGLVWVLGAVLGGSGLLQIGWRMRRLAVQEGF